MRSSDWSSDVCSSDLLQALAGLGLQVFAGFLVHALHGQLHLAAVHADALHLHGVAFLHHVGNGVAALRRQLADVDEAVARTQDVHEGAERSEEHTSELQSLMRISYALLCLQQKNTQNT